MDKDLIPVSELFADLQVSLTEIALIDMLGKDATLLLQRRRTSNIEIVDAITVIIRKRYSNDEILHFLEYGYSTS